MKQNVDDELKRFIMYILSDKLYIGKIKGSMFKFYRSSKGHRLVSPLLIGEIVNDRGGTKWNIQARLHVFEYVILFSLIVIGFLILFLNHGTVMQNLLGFAGCCMPYVLKTVPFEMITNETVSELRTLMEKHNSSLVKAINLKP